MSPKMILSKYRGLLITSSLVIGISSITAKLTSAQFVDSKQDSLDQGVSKSSVIRTTLDRTDVPLVTETKETEINKKTSRKDSVTKVLRADGSYDNWISTSTIEKKHNENRMERSTQIYERDRQGNDRPVKEIKETVTKSAAGELHRTGHYQRNHSGQLVLQKEISSVSAKRSDGSMGTVRTEMKVDLNGRMMPNQEVYEVMTQLSPSEQYVTRTVKSVDRMNGRLAISAKESVMVKTEGNNTISETTIQKPTRSGWSVTDQVRQIERQRPDGTIERETVELGQSIYSRATGSTSPLVPKMKTIEQQVRKPDGTTVMEKKVYKRDVNGEWITVNFVIGSPPIH